jgi:hypothetical protein
MTNTNQGAGGMLIAAALVASLLTFVSTQLWFAIDLARALFKMHTA